MGVFILGMHRSGTSVTTNIVADLGLDLGDPNNLLPATDDNARGYFEVERLTDFNHRLLTEFGGDVMAPPDVLPALTPDIASRMSGEFRRAFGDVAGKWAWKDPTNCILLPLWREVLGSGHLAVVSVRDPRSSARSLVARRDGITIDAALALWERYTRFMLAGLEGLAVHIVRYEDLVQEPHEQVGMIADFLSSNNISISTPEAAYGAVAPELQHSSREADTVEVSSHQRELQNRLDSLVGSHASFEAPDLGPEPAEVGARLAERRQIVAHYQPVIDSLRRLLEASEHGHDVDALIGLEHQNYQLTAELTSTHERLFTALTDLERNRQELAEHRRLLADATIDRAHSVGSWKQNGISFLSSLTRRRRSSGQA
ncbi:MAG: sulfotransferase [Acidimicrobiales bacterium]